MANASLEELRYVLGAESAYNDTWLQMCLTTAQQRVQAHCGRTFETAATSATTRNFAPNDEEVVYVDDLASTTDLVIVNDTSAVSLSWLQLEPVNQLGIDGLYRPITALRFKKLSGATWHIYDNEEASVQVTGRWGWTGGCPETVRYAVISVAKDLVTTQSMAGGSTLVPTFGSFVEQHEAAAYMLEAYRRWDRVVGIA